MDVHGFLWISSGKMMSEEEKAMDFLDHFGLKSVFRVNQYVQNQKGI